MTSEVIALAEKNPLRQTTIRVNPELLRKARFFLDEEGKNVSEFLIEQLEQYVKQREQQRPPLAKGECA